MGTTKDVTAELLDGFVGKNITSICGNGFTDAEVNHCAHFVNHVMELGFAYSCKDATGGKQPAANLRVHETFSRCGEVGKWPPASLAKCYAFVTKESAVDLAKKSMVNIPRKHIGIYCDTHVWHYSNTHDKVVKATPEAFAKHFSGDGFAMFYGEFPTLVETWNTEITWPVAWGDLDAYRHVNNSVFMRWLENARVRWLDVVGFPEEDDRHGPVVVSATIDFRRPVTYPETSQVRVRTRAADLGRTSVTLEYQVLDSASGELIAEASTRVVLVDFGNRQAVPLPDDARQRIHQVDDGVTLR